MTNTKEIFIDTETGEAVDITKGIFVPYSELEKRKKYKEIGERFKEQGGFVWLFYKKIEELKVPVSPANLTRLIYLATYMNYENRLVMDVSLNPLSYDTAINKNQLIDIMKLPKNTFYRFYEEVVSNNILIEKENGYYLNEKFFKKGSVGRLTDFKKMRLYILGIRRLYSIAKIKDHKTLGLAFMLIPYTSIEYNVICWNPCETDYSLVEPIEIHELMELFGYDRHNVKRFAKRFMKIVVTDYQLLHLVDEEKFFVSPTLYYAGTNIKNVQALMAFDTPVKK